MSYTEEIDGKQDRGTSAVRILEIVASNLESLVGETFARNLMQCTAHRNPHWESCFCRTRLVRISYRRYCHCQTEKVSNVGPYVCTKAVTVSDLHVPHSQVLGPCVSRPRAWGKAGWQLGHLSPRVCTEYTVSLPISLIEKLFVGCRKDSCLWSVHSGSCAAASRGNPGVVCGGQMPHWKDTKRNE
jgi:hypothetical protein